ncbi:M14 family zinc carboxypeptidase [uncultured Winogradskyella sp.]|uniref:M14 family zinc carboxypeptidase n=1 Tax=uncultured Winogradskyella sp. TaxID=395353 RepID=UPI0030D89370|tara:strand:- start:1111 stop:2289 length:1179 start_codon:yes stop_codon:yes gene_type:complete
MITFVNQFSHVMKLAHLNSIYSLFKTPELFGRYLTSFQIEKSLSKFPKSIISIIGYSVEDRPIYNLKFGHGPIKILLWSQMHGNESTTTKALFDCFNLFETNNFIPNSILNACTLCVIPILNPDGAERYTRINANEIDLNRDAQDLSQPESKILRDIYNSFQPDYCFNLHGQRSIFGVNDSGISATLSFLSPSQDEECSLTPNRKVAMAVIAEVNNLLQEEIPNSIGRYNDGFNLDCVGDTFQNFGVPTLLYEAGHYSNDYNREDVRRFMFIAIIKGLDIISKGVDGSNYKDYFKIPKNSKSFYDIIIRNAKVFNSDFELTDIAVQYKEVLKANRIEFRPFIEAISKLDKSYGHKEIDAKGGLVRNIENLELKVGYENDFVLVNNKKISLKP